MRSRSSRWVALPLLLSLTLVSLSAWATEAPPSEVAPTSTTEATGPALGLSIKNFQVEGTAYSQGSIPIMMASSVYTGRLGWNPQYQLKSWLGFRGDAGVGFPKSYMGNIFFVVNTDVALTLRPFSWFQLEVGGGQQFWTDAMKINPDLTGNLAFIRNKKWFGIIDRVVVGYSNLFLSTVPTHQLRAGLGIAL